MKFFTITKPGIIFGNIVTLSGGFFLGSQGHINYLLWLIAAVGMSLIIGSGCVFNNVIDKDIDGLMERTKGRVLVLGLISSQTALLYAITLALLGFALLYALTNPLTLLFAVLGFFVYVVVYSLMLKRRSTYSTIIGSVAGAVAPVIGYTAATNRLDLGALLLFCILLLWQMPHFYAISIYRMNDFKAAAIPVLPLKRTMFYTKISMLVYMLLFTIAAVLPTLFGYAGNIYFAVALLASCYWLYLGLKGFKTNNDQRWAKQVFGFSIILIALLCVAMAFPW